MPRAALTGSRIRERRIDMGLKQSQLASLCDISPSYLNLIEHNRRRIGGKLLVRLAASLGTDATALSEGADDTLLDALGDAAARWSESAPETARSEEFAGRFPGWATLIMRQSERIAGLERTVEMLNDRLTHDPQLADALHDVLSSVTAIRSASAILTDEEGVDPEWQARFHRNIFEDSGRLTEAARGLVGFLEGGADSTESFATPQEALEAWLAARDFHVPDLERALPASYDKILSEDDPELDGAARSLALGYLERTRKDAEAMPLPDMRAALAQGMVDPAVLADRFSVDVIAVFRRIAALPRDALPWPVGLAISDASGSMLFRRPLDGFPLPKFGAACPLLPLYQALVRPMTPVFARVEVAGRAAMRFQTYAIAQPVRPAAFGTEPVFETAMLILPENPSAPGRGLPVEIGPGCRICTRESCAARREPSILSPAE